MKTGQNVAFQRQRLRAELRNERKLARRTQKQVARAMDWSPSKVLRIETGAVGISVTDLRALLSYYNLEDEQEIEELISLARAVRTRRGSRGNSIQRVVTHKNLETDKTKGDSKQSRRDK